MTLTVRLEESIAAALARHCTATGATKSSVVQQSLAAYLMNEANAGGAGPTAAERSAPRPSTAFSAFERAGLVGTGSLEGTSADKAAVRRRITGAA